MPHKLWLSLRRLLQVHKSGDCGSPRVVGSTSERRSSMRLASVALIGLRPAPGLRTRSASTAAPERNSLSARTAGKTRRARHSHYPAVSRRQRLGHRKPPPAPFVQHRIERLKPLADGRFIHHASMLLTAAPHRNPKIQISTRFTYSRTTPKVMLSSPRRSASG